MSLGWHKKKPRTSLKMLAWTRRWWWEVLMDEDYDNRIFIEDIKPIVFVDLPEDVDVANKFREINEVFDDYRDNFSLPYGNDVLEPDLISAFAGGQDAESGYTFKTPFLKIEYPNLQQIAYQSGEPYTLENLQSSLEALEESSRMAECLLLSQPILMSRTALIQSQQNFLLSEVMLTIMIFI